MIFTNILVVCTGNICRSPMAEAMLKAKLPADYKISSAGVGALVGHAADDNALAVMQSHGLDLSQHRAQQITNTLCHDADLILIMDQIQTQALYKLAPAERGKVMRLGHWIQRDIPDPYQQSREAFEFVYELMLDAVNAWQQHLCPSLR